jgi:hypothetical protein
MNCRVEISFYSDFSSDCLISAGRRTRLCSRVKLGRRVSGVKTRRTRFILHTFERKNSSRSNFNLAFSTYAKRPGSNMRGASYLTTSLATSYYSCRTATFLPVSNYCECEVSATFSLPSMRSLTRLLEERLDDPPS